VRTSNPTEDGPIWRVYTFVSCKEKNDYLKEVRDPKINTIYSVYYGNMS
jgi:hypothetical protein